MTWRTSTDQMGNILELTSPPQRIVSLVPSQTELLFDLGLEQQVVGITKFCVHPSQWRKSKTIVGGTKKFDLEIIRSLRPDLVIGNKEENYKEGITALRRQYPIWMSDIASFEHALEMIEKVSTLTGKEGQGREIINRIKSGFSRRDAHGKDLTTFPAARVLYLMWKKPWMGAAGKTFIHAMMEKAGIVNVLASQERYPKLSSEMIKELNPSVVLLSTEPYPFSEKHVPEIIEMLSDAQVLIVDGEMFSWYGSRLALAPAYFNSLKIRR